MAPPIKQDHLTALPAELLTKVAVHLPSAGILSLSQTSTGLRIFLAYNAHAICNEALRTRFLEHVKRLRCELKDGWLVPTHPKLLDSEDEAALVYWRSFNYFWNRHADEKTRRSLIRIRISDPGPGFFYIMERELKFVELEEECEAKSAALRNGSAYIFGHELTVAEVKATYVDYKVRIGYHRTESFNKSGA